jgi:hypothetical protein
MVPYCTYTYGTKWIFCFEHLTINTYGTGLVTLP